MPQTARKNAESARHTNAAIEIAAYLATLAAHYRLTGKFKDS